MQICNGTINTRHLAGAGGLPKCSPIHGLLFAGSGFFVSRFICHGVHSQWHPHTMPSQHHQATTLPTPHAALQIAQDCKTIFCVLTRYPDLLPRREDNQGKDVVSLMECNLVVSKKICPKRFLFQKQLVGGGETFLTTSDCRFFKGAPILFCQFFLSICFSQKKKRPGSNIETMNSSFCV